MRELSAERGSPQAPTKSLEELFRKTSTTPAIYWKPLTEEQVKHRVELRNKVRQLDSHTVLQVVNIFLLIAEVDGG